MCFTSDLPLSFISQTVSEPSSVSPVSSSLLSSSADCLDLTDYDKILVLGAGEVLEFDSPANLLEQEGSVFADLCHKSGEYDDLRAIAMAKRDKERS